jgi:Carboxypeptidase regulatory-like domain
MLANYYLSLTERSYHCDVEVGVDMRSNTQHAFKFRRSSAVIVLVIMCFAQAQSQNGILTGIVKDTSGAAVPEAKINLKAGNGQVLQTTTDNAGSFTIESTPGVYTLTASSQGFKVFTEVVHLTANAPVVEQVVLQLGYCTNCVTVTVCDLCEVQPEPIQSLNSLLPLESIPPFKFHPKNSKNRLKVT